eukprot:1141799-Pelagomonas_calceolata.AAC.3
MPRHAQAAPFCDKLIFSKIAARFGGRLKAVVSGGAPLAPHVEEFLRVTMCAPVVQGYGLTETCAVSFISVTDEFKQLGTVGTPTPLTELRLESVPELNYDALDPEEPKVCVPWRHCRLKEGEDGGLLLGLSLIAAA